jgi:hypothetical protein
MPEAEGVVKAELPPDDATAKVAELKRLLSKKEASSERNAERAPERAKVRAN